MAVLTTQATSENLGFKTLIKQHRQGVKVFIQPCPGLVEFIERGLQNSDKCTSLLKQYIKPLVEAGVDTIVLGCTHYPFVQHHIRAIAGDQVTIIETAKPVTLHLTNRLTELNLATEKQHQGKLICFSSNATAQQEKVMSKLLHTNIFVNSLY